MASTKYYLDMRGRAEDGKGSVRISIFHNHTTATIPTGIRVSVKEWSGESVIRREDSSILNAKLSKQKSEIDSKIAVLSLAESFDKLTATEIKHAISGEKESLDRHYVAVLFDEYMKMDLSEGTKEIYRATLDKVLGYGGHKLRIEAITVKWLYGFEQYLAKTQGVNGRSIYLRSLRAVCNFAYKTGACGVYPFDIFKIKSVPTKKRNILLDDFRKFISFPTTQQNAMYRDYFMLMFFLIGVNAVDLLTAQPNAIVNGRFEYFRHKTHKFYSIRIEPEAQVLLEKYHGQNYLLEALDHCRHHKNFLHEMNDALKTIGDEYEETVCNPESLFETTVTKVKPIIPDISTYYARHTWATLAHELGISSDVIAMALGHSPVHRTTFIYIQPDQSKVDAANRKVIDYLMQYE